MREIKNVQGSQESVQALEINVDTVYVRTNIVPVSTEQFKGWQYDEIQYSKDEFLQLTKEKADQLEKDKQELENKLIETRASIESVNTDFTQFMDYAMSKLPV